jgi:hypothetical protein
LSHYWASQFHRERGILTQLPPSWSNYQNKNDYNFCNKKKRAKCPLRKKKFSNERDRYDPHESVRGREANIDFVRYTIKESYFYRRHLY